MRRVLAALALSALVVVAVSACPKRSLRGFSEPSPDGRTYLVFDDANEGACRVLKVDGKPWKFRQGVKGQIKPGDHA